MSSKDRQYNSQKKKDKKTMIHNTPRIKTLPNMNPNKNGGKQKSSSPEELAVPAPTVVPIMLLLNDMNI